MKMYIKLLLLLSACAPLFLQAASSIALGIAKTLIAFGADIRKAETGSKNAFMIAQESGNQYVQRFLINVSNKRKQALIQHMRTDNLLAQFPPGLLPLIAEYAE